MQTGYGNLTTAGMCGLSYGYIEASNSVYASKPNIAKSISACVEAELHRAMTWMQRLKRVFNIDVEICEHCGGHVKVIASIDDPKVIERILKHLKQKAAKADRMGAIWAGSMAKIATRKANE